MLPVLGFWFGADADHAERRCRQWLANDPALGEELRAWATPLAELAAAGTLDHLASRPIGSLSLALLLDATPRALWHGTARAYKHDLAAQGHVLHALATRQDASLDRWQRMMLYLPLMHAENMDLQERSLKEYSNLLIGATGAEKQVAEGFLDLATECREIIWRFGRFPDRNAPLHRITSLEELWYLHDTQRPWFAPQPRTGEEVEHEVHAAADEADIAADGRLADVPPEKPRHLTR